ncbi:hypothetical protein BN903_7 [Halorubrum sp. AJ67]|nr:hypothetical protein BN903_7 [Halorubrum sp. AJ67]
MSQTRERYEPIAPRERPSLPSAGDPLTRESLVRPCYRLISPVIGDSRRPTSMYVRDRMPSTCATPEPGGTTW